jgi:glucan phosphorylase
MGARSAQLRELAPLADDPGLREDWREAKRKAKLRLARLINQRNRLLVISRRNRR